MIRTYSELIKLPTFMERFNYLKLDGIVAKETFGWERYLNQVFYSTSEWKQLRHLVIVRDLGCDLGCSDREIGGSIYIHHMNPITSREIISKKDDILNPEFLICTSFTTHNAIHYGDAELLLQDPICRTPNDTCPWKK